MVLLDKSIPAAAYDSVVRSLAATYNFRIHTEWGEEPRGFVGRTTLEVNAERLAADPRVRLVEENFAIELSGTQWSNWNNEHLWHLDRLDEDLYANNDGNYDMCPEGRGIFAYIIDTGVRTDHEQFNLDEPSRVVQSLDFSTGALNGVLDTTNGCANNHNLWHGTAVASVLAGSTVGAAKPQVISLRYFTCNGQSQSDWIVNAVRWIGSGANTRRGEAGLVNYSGGVGHWRGQIFATLEDAVDTLVQQEQIPFFTSAENFSGDACQFAPNALAYTNANTTGSVFTVGATSLGGGSDTTDYRYQTGAGAQPLTGQDTGSNGGSCVSIYAPGVAIYAARNSAVNAYGRADGSSFSSPLAAGVAARWMAHTGQQTHTQVYNYLLGAATSGIVNHVATPAYWYCVRAAGTGALMTTSTTATACVWPYVGVNNTTTPFFMPGTNNESNAGLLFSDMTCP